MSKETLADLLKEFWSVYGKKSMLFYDWQSLLWHADLSDDSECFGSAYFKEKLRVRTRRWRQAEMARIFLKIKKKVHGLCISDLCDWVVDSKRYLAGNASLRIRELREKEIGEWLCKRYGGVQPMMYIYYNRYSFWFGEDSMCGLPSIVMCQHRTKRIKFVSRKRRQEPATPTTCYPEIKITWEGVSTLAGRDSGLLPRFQKSFSKIMGLPTKKNNRL